jgi:haloacetate dehalogenase
MKARTAAMPADPTGPLFSGFAALDCKTSRVHFAGVIGGEGPPVLLLHGIPKAT